MDEVAENQNTGKLSGKQMAQAIAWITARMGSDPKCPTCSGSDWFLGDILVRVQASNALVGGVGFPLIGMVCKKCGNTQFLNTLVMGILKNQPSEESDG